MAKLNLQQSVIVLTGGFNTGKTTGAYTFEPPSNIGRVFIHDGESSGNRFIEQLAKRGNKFGFYMNLDDRWVETTGKRTADLLKQLSIGSLPWANTKERDSMINFYLWVLDDLDKNLQPGMFDTYIFDPVERLEAGMQAWVEANRDASGWSRRGYGEMWRKGFYPLYRGLFTAIHDRGVKTIILTAHLGNPWTDEGPVPGKVKPRAKPELFKLSQFYGWLVNEPSNVHGEPACVVLKERLGTVDENQDDTWNTQRRIPRRIPRFTWDEVQRYLTEGCNLANPAPGEVPSAEEEEMINDALSDKQMQLMLLRAQTAYLEKRAASSFTPQLDEGKIDPPDVLARSLYNGGKGMSVEQISATLSTPIPIVSNWIA
jgi:hypothetical protein